MDWSVDLEEQYDKVYRYCYFRLRSREAAEDVTQEAFLRYLSAASQKPNAGYALPCLYTIARNLCMDEFRRKKAEPLPEEKDGFWQPAEPDRTEQIVEEISLKHALSGLSQEDRELILLRYVNEVPITVICRMFGISRFAAYRRIRKALRQLRESWKG